jgi:hypothetical protein
LFVVVMMAEGEEETADHPDEVTWSTSFRDDDDGEGLPAARRDACGEETAGPGSWNAEALAEEEMVHLVAGLPSSVSHDTQDDLLHHLHLAHPEGGFEPPPVGQDEEDGAAQHAAAAAAHRFAERAVDTAVAARVHRDLMMEAAAAAAGVAVVVHPSLQQRQAAYDEEGGVPGEEDDDRKPAARNDDDDGNEPGSSVAAYPRAAVESLPRDEQGLICPSGAERARCKTQRALRALQTFYRRVNEFVAFRVQQGHGDVPQQQKPLGTVSYWNRPEESLGVFLSVFYSDAIPLLNVQWVNKQRQLKKKKDKGAGGGSSSMTDDHVRVLEAIGFQWGKSKDVWDERYEELKAWKQEHNGDCNVPTKRGGTLGRWVSEQRRQYKEFRDDEGKKRKRGDAEESPGFGDDSTKKKRKKLSPERVAKLNALGFNWSMN